MVAPPRTDDYGLVHDFYNTFGVNKIRDTKELRQLRKELQFYLEHVDKRKLGLVFSKCRRQGCACGGSFEPWETSALLRDFTHLGSRLPSATPSTTLPGHYMTLLDHLGAGPKDRLPSDSFCPSRISKGLGWCSDCPSYAFSSATDQKEHKKRLHGAIVSGEPKENLSLPTHSCGECEEVFTSLWERNTHLRRSKHTNAPKATKLKNNKPGVPKSKVDHGRYTGGERNRKAPAGQTALPVPTSSASSSASVPSQSKRKQKKAPATKGASHPPRKRARRRAAKSMSSSESEESEQSEESEEDFEESEEEKEEEEEEAEGESGGEDCEEGNGWAVVEILGERWVVDKKGADRQYHLLFQTFRFPENQKWRDAVVHDKHDMPPPVLAAWRVAHAPADAKWVAGKGVKKGAVQAAKAAYIAKLSQQ